MKITVLSDNLEYVKEKIETLNKKALKLNKKEIVLNYTDSYIDSSDLFDIKEVVDVEIETEQIIISGYKIVAKIDHTYPEKNFVHAYEEIKEELIQKWEDLTSRCEHCNTNRKRKFTYILQHQISKNFIQVGKSCMKDFLGYDVANVLTYYDLLENLEEQIKSIAYKKFNNVCFYKILDVLNLINKEIQENGYYSSKECWHTEEKTTSTRVREKIRKIDNFEDMSIETEEKLRNMINYFKNYNFSKEELESDFYNKLRDIFRHDYCKNTDINILSCFFNTVDILKEKEEIKNTQLKSKYMYNVKDKIEIELTEENVFSYITQYGVMYISLFKDCEGNIYKWCSKDTLNIKKGEFKTVKATVKDHAEYKGVKQTVLTRCKATQNENTKDIIKEEILFKEEIDGYNVELIIDIYKNLEDSCSYIKVETKEQDIIKYDLYNCNFTKGDFEYKKGIKGIKALKNYIEDNLYENIQKKLGYDNLACYSELILLNIKKEYI